MAFQLLQPRSDSGDLGEALGTGIGQGLQQLAQNRLQQMLQGQQDQRAQQMQQQRAQQFEERGLPGILGLLKGPSQATALKEFIRAPQAQAYGDALKSILNAGSGEELNLPQNIGEGLSPEQFSSLVDTSFKKQSAESRDKADRFKATQSYRDTVLDKDKAADLALGRIKDMERLGKTGKLDNPLYVKFLKNIGWDIGTLLSPESEAFEKLQADFLRDVKSIFGGRVTNLEVEKFLKSLPSLTQSQKGRDYVTAKFKALYSAQKEEADVMAKIIKENNGIPPYDLREQVREKMKGRLDELGKEFASDLLSGPSSSVKELVADTALYAEGTRATNDDTGEEFIFEGGSWKPLKGK